MCVCVCVIVRVVLESRNVDSGPARARDFDNASGRGAG